MTVNMRRRPSLILGGVLVLALLVILRFSGRNAKAGNGAETGAT